MQPNEDCQVTKTVVDLAFSFLLLWFIYSIHFSMVDVRFYHPFLPPFVVVLSPL
jgi:hypothetical protein